MLREISSCCFAKENIILGCEQAASSDLLRPFNSSRKGQRGLERGESIEGQAGGHGHEAGDHEEGERGAVARGRVPASEARLAAEDRQQADPVPDERRPAQDEQRGQAPLPAPAGHRGLRRTEASSGPHNNYHPPLLSLGRLDGAIFTVERRETATLVTWPRMTVLFSCM